MSQRSFPASSLPRNVKLLGLASLLNDIASEMVYPLLPQFLLAVLRGSLRPGMQGFGKVRTGLRPLGYVIFRDIAVWAWAKLWTWLGW